MEVGLGPGHIVLSLDMGTQLLPPPHAKGHSSPLLTFAIYCIRMFKQSLFVRSITLDSSRLAMTGVASLFAARGEFNSYFPFLVNYIIVK